MSADFNRDGAVDAANYVVWRDRLGMLYRNPTTISGFSFRPRHCGGSATGSAPQSHVPEPTTVLLLFMGMTLITSKSLIS